MTSSKVVRAIIGVVVLLVLLVLVLNWVGDYRSATRKPAGTSKGTSSAEATSTETTGEELPDDTTDPSAEPTSSADVVLGRLIVKVDGLNFRKEPRTDSKAMRGLKKGEQVDLIEDLGDWFKVRDADGVAGYITSSSSYTRSGD